MPKQKKLKNKQRLRRNTRSLSASQKPANQLFRKMYFIAMIIVGTIGLNWQFKPLQVKSLEPTPVVEHIIPVEIKRNALPTYIKISTLIDEIIEEHSVSVDGIPTVSDNHAAYFSDSARPGELGNMIIYGHNKKHIFGNLHGVKVGNEIEITTADNTIVKYKITEIHTVETTQTQWLEQTDNAVITVYTCTGFMDRLRLVVRGELVS